MNWLGAQVYEAKRKLIAMTGPGTVKTTGALAPFTAQLLQHDKMTAAYKQEYDVGRQYAKDHYRPKPFENLRNAEQLRVANELDEQLEVAKGKDPVLRELGEYISFKTGTAWIQGPIKVVGGKTEKDRGAFVKTVKDYILDWTANKDLIRGTCAARTQVELLSVVARIDIICSPEYGMTLIKRAETKPGSPKNECGYSGWNFVVVMKGSEIPAEIQANTYAMMYGKMSKKDYTEQLLGNDGGLYDKTKGEMGFEGGLGHLFYEIWGQDKDGDDGKAAAALGTKYNAMCRNGKADARVKKDIDDFGNKLKQAGSKEIWAKRTHH
jgi:hypothetical protein